MKTKTNFLFIVLFFCSLMSCSPTLEPVDQGRFDDDGSGAGSSLTFQPAFTTVSPNNIANENNPALQGTSEANVSIEFFTDSSCTTSTGVTGSTDGAGNFTITVPVADDTVTTFWAQANSVGLGTSACSSNSITFTEDSTPPSVPIVDSSSPVSPADNSSPTISGTGDANETITLYSDAACTTQIASGTLDGAGNYSVSISVTPGSTNAVDVYADSTDVANNKSACSATTLNYEAYTIPTGFAWLKLDSATVGNINVAATTAASFNFSRFDSAFYNHSTTTNSHLLTVLQPGDYLVSHTIPMTGTVGQRTTLLSEIRINGVTIAPGSASASSYIRNSSGHLESSNHNTVLLTGLSINDTIELIYIRSTTITDTVNVDGHITMAVEYIPASETIFAATGTQTTNGVDLSEPTGFNMEWIETSKNGITHSDGVNPQNIQIDTTGSYLVHLNIPVEGVISRGNINVRIQVDGVTVAGGEAKQAYIRNTSGHNEASVHWSGLIPSITSGSILTVNVIQEGANGTMNVLTGKPASIFVQMIDSSSNVLHLRATELTGGTNWNPTTKDTIKWDNQDLTDPAVFSHSTGVNPHQITVLTDGDYQLYYSDAFTSTLTRGNPRITVQVNGTDVPGATTKTHYMRNSSQNEASGTLVFLLDDLSANDIITISAQAEAATGTVNDTSESLLTLIRK